MDMGEWREKNKPQIHFSILKDSLEEAFKKWILDYSMGPKMFCRITFFLTASTDWLFYLNANDKTGETLTIDDNRNAIKRLKRTMENVCVENNKKLSFEQLIPVDKKYDIQRYSSEVGSFNSMLRYLGKETLNEKYDDVIASVKTYGENIENEDEYIIELYRKSKFNYEENIRTGFTFAEIIFFAAACEASFQRKTNVLNGKIDTELKTASAEEWFDEFGKVLFGRKLYDCMFALLYDDLRNLMNKQNYEYYETYVRRFLVDEKTSKRKDFERLEKNFENKKKFKMVHKERIKNKQTIKRGLEYRELIYGYQECLDILKYSMNHSLEKYIDNV
ncbi:MAG: hypothetical protein IJO22_01570 [Oscillospiraceae bacterium]|nr:hypothetical protein [Oscillospiraceae bacterium]